MVVQNILPHYLCKQYFDYVLHKLFQVIVELKHIFEYEDWQLNEDHLLLLFEYGDWKRNEIHVLLV